MIEMFGFGWLIGSLLTIVAIGLSKSNHDEEIYHRGYADGKRTKEHNNGTSKDKQL